MEFLTQMLRNFHCSLIVCPLYRCWMLYCCNDSWYHLGAEFVMSVPCKDLSGLGVGGGGGGGWGHGEPATHCMRRKFRNHLLIIHGHDSD